LKYFKPTGGGSKIKTGLGVGRLLLHAKKSAWKLKTEFGEGMEEEGQLPQQMFMISEADI
jgi:hypothetical protein